MSAPNLPDALLLTAILWESIERGCINPDDAFAWAAQNGYIEIDDHDDNIFRVTEEGLRHVMQNTLVPAWN